MIYEPLLQDPLTLRQAVLTDLDEIKELFTATITTICTNDYTPEQIAVWASTVENSHRWYDAVAGQLFLLAEMDDKIVGFASLDNSTYIDFMYVHKDYQRQGIAEILMEELEIEARDFGTITLTSDVSKTARPFFERIGFEVVTEQLNLRRGVEIVNYKMSKALL
ncbi:GNAT family N-acetyltransferase [Flavobacterium cerinum]|uniref:GNAT family N-acetyltransferase n=1 Tax=Flavobacterium cerinum TaxID=2502784 RepID=A0A444GN22_9FLAO|nr:GNAT family N-acetyltransferase [Flavobacterium cerinum]RWW92334.1 GNAT family N-acetyltransferase [Flavobacterium cerinum]